MYSVHCLSSISCCIQLKDIFQYIAYIYCHDLQNTLISVPFSVIIVNLMVYSKISYFKYLLMDLLNALVKFVIKRKVIESSIYFFKYRSE